MIAATIVGSQFLAAFVVLIVARPRLRMLRALLLAITTGLLLWLLSVAALAYWFVNAG